MGTIVVDNSALLPLFLFDEADEYARGLLSQRAAGDSLIAPSLCLLEFGNCILKAVRQGRLTEAEATIAHREFVLLPIDFRDAPASSSLPSIHSLAQRQSVSFYDAAYLALAISKEAKIATLDKALKRAANAEGVALA